MLAILIALVLWAAGLGLGRLIVYAAGWSFDGRLQQFVWQTAVGWVGISLIFFGLGLAGWLRPAPVWTLLGSLALVGSWVGFKLAPPIRRPRLWARAAAVLAAAGLIGLLALLALAPPIGAGMAWDGLMYHLPTIQTWVNQGRIAPIPSIPFSNYPMGFNLLFVPGLMAGWPEVAQLAHWSAGVLAMLATYLLARQLLPGEWSVLAGLSFWLLPLVRQEATWPMNDLGLLLYATLALLALARWQAEPVPGWLILAGIMTGFAASVKVTAVFPVIALSMLVLALSLKSYQKGWQPVWKTWLRFGVPLVLVSGLWYLKNWVQVGNPFFPFLFDYFGGDFWTAAANERFRLSQLGRGLQLPGWMRTAVLLGGVIYLGSLPRIPRLSLNWKMLLAYPALIGLSWLVTKSPQSRYLLPVYPVFLVIVWGMAGYGLRVLSFSVRPSWLYLFLLAGTILSIGQTIQTQPAELAVALGRTERQTYLARRFYMYPAYAFANSQLPPTSKLLIFPEDRTYYLNREYLWGDPISQGIIEYADYAAPVDFLADLQVRGVTHVVLSHPAFDFFINWESHNESLVDYMTAAHQLITDLASTEASLIFSENGVEIYALP